MMGYSMIAVISTFAFIGTTIACLVVGSVATFFLSKYIGSNKIGKAKSTAYKIIEDAYAEAKVIKKESILETKEELNSLREEYDKEIKERRSEVQKSENRILQRQEVLDRKEEILDKKQENIDQLKEELDIKIKQQEHLNLKTIEINEEKLKELEKVSKLSKEEAKNILIESITEEAKRDAAITIREIENEAKEEGNKRAKEIVTLAIQKCATDHTSEATISTVALPNDEVKGRIIGREGRNIRALENATGIDLIVDDTPEMITISGFDPVRREIARISLEKLILDGRIHPTRIEEIVDKVTKDVDQVIKQAGENACFDANIHNLHPELVKILGRLKYRTSYGQNVLKHSLETCFLAGILAAEVGADEKIAKRGGLLHDIGKAVDHEVEGTHVTIGVDLAKKYKESPEVIHCIEAHHGGVEFRSLEAILVQVADAISSSRPGARRETLENYVKRLEKLEEISNSFEGVEKSFAIQAGREVRIIVKPEEVDDAKAVILAHDIAKKIESEMEYPGQIKVNVIRESRTVDYAK